MTVRRVLIPLHGRGELAFARIHGETLLGHAVTAGRRLGLPVIVCADATLHDRVREEVGSVTLSAATGWAMWPEGSVVVHDPLCPLVPTSFLAEMVDRHASAPEVAQVACRPVTDTVKTAAADRIGHTLDRERLIAITSPVVVPAEHLAERRGPSPGTAFGALAARLRSAGAVDWVRAPSLGRRVDDFSAVNLLECVDELAHQMG